MRGIAVAGTLVGVAALVSGCWAFGPLTGREVEASPPVRVVLQTARPNASPWAAQSIVMLQLRDPLGADVTADRIADTAQVIGDRLAAFGVTANVSSVPDARLRIELAEGSDAEAVQRVATAIGDLRFVPVPGTFADAIVDGAPLPDGMPVQPLFSGASVASSELGTDQLGQPVIDIQLDAKAADAFDDWAADHQGERFAMLLDGLVISAPTINAAEFNGRAQISGDFDLPATQELLAILQGGVLPVTAEVLSVCPTTAEDCASPSATPTGLGGG